MPPPRQLMLRRNQRTSPVIWLFAIICAFTAVAVIITGIVVFVIYMIYQPKLPYISVPYAHLDRLDYDQSGLLSIQMTLAVVAENDNRKAHAGFSDMGFVLRFHGIEVAELAVGEPFDVPKNSSVALRYVVPAAPLPLDETGMAEMDAALKVGKVGFELVGQARTRWRVGIFLSVKFWTHLDCKLQFSTVNGTSIGPECTSKSG